MVDTRGGDVFLLLPQVLLDGGVSENGCGAVGLDLSATRRLLERVRDERGEEPSKTILPMVGRTLSKGTMFEQASEESSPFLTDLNLAELFLTGTKMFVTFTLFS